MKRRLMAVLLGLGLSVCSLSAGVYAAEAQTEAESGTEDGSAESETEAGSEEKTEAAEDETEAAAEETPAASEDVTEAASEEASESETEASSEAETETEAETESTEDQLKDFMTYYLTQVDAWTEDEVDELADGTGTSALIALNWQAVRGELGSFVEVLDAEFSDTGYAIVGHAKYSGADDRATVTVTMEYSVDTSSYSTSVDTIEWEVSYPMGVQMQRAALNTLMGIGVVFLALLFLSWVIGKLHYIPDLIESRKKKDEPEPAPAAAAVPVPEPEPEPPFEEISPADDLELVAVIAAAIAASEGKASADGYVVRSIRRINKNNWRRA